MDWAALIDDLDARLVVQSVLLDQARTVEAAALTVYAMLGIDTVAITTDGRLRRLGPTVGGVSAVVPEGGVVLDALHPDDHAAFTATCQAVQADVAPRLLGLQLLAPPDGSAAIRWTPVTVVIVPQWSEVEAAVDGLLLVVLPAVMSAPDPLLLMVREAAAGPRTGLPATRAAVLPPRADAPVVLPAPATEAPRRAPAS